MIRMAPARICSVCTRWPCQCARSTPATVVGPLRMPCACGLTVVSATMLYHDVAFAVARHNVEPLHERWREENDL